MSRVIRAVFENGVLRPLEPLDLPDRSEVELAIQAPNHWAKEFRELLARIHAKTGRFSGEEIEADITAASRESQGG
ncbi:MAG: antitoxin family protein [Candidatus Rokubacteria bacterium]|nr:antitoxin family protein [Deltaproteobacteria bacterium]MBI3077068.1 antitoxin family protein [Deltaproteobacteria bacterium]MBI4611604.1 antitoxin family protein [Candidatus Rokubacteria bacterium]